MWVLLLPLGLGSALLPPGRGDPSEGCGLCRSSHRGWAQANGTLGASVTLGCPVASVALGELQAVRWDFSGGPTGASAVVCSRSRGRLQCDPRYDTRATLPAPAGTPGVLELWHLRDEDAGTYSCLLLGEGDCACGEVTLLLRSGAPCGPPCSRDPTRGGFGLGLLLLLLLLLPSPARGL